MQLADRLSSAHNAISDSASQKVSGLNQGVYQRLKQALGLNLRRQIFLAVCDDLTLRNRLAAQLYAELAYPPQSSTPNGHRFPNNWQGGRSSAGGDRILADNLTAEPSVSLAYPRLVSLNLNLTTPDPFAQIEQWLSQYPAPKGIYHQPQPPAFQILGTERLTRQSGCVQKQFLSSLQEAEKYLSGLEFSLLLWLPRPWLHVVQQSAPAFWDWRTGLFEFEGDPTPVPSGTVGSVADPAASAVVSRQSAKITQPKTTKPESLQAHQSETKTTAKQEILKKHPSGQANLTETTYQTSKPTTASNGIAIDSSSVESPGQETDASKEELWDILAYDLERLKDKQEEEQSVESQTTSASEHLPASKAAKPSKSRSSLALLPYPLHSIQDLASLVMRIAMQESEEEASHSHPELIQALERIQQLHLHQASNDELVAAYLGLGNLYRDRVEQGDSSESTLLIAICAYEIALQWLDDDTIFWSDTLNDIGNLYWILSRGISEPEKGVSYLERAIAAYQCGLAPVEPQVHPQSYAMVQNNLGSAYGDLARYRTPGEALEKSVRAYESALHYRTLEDDPARYAATQNNLGTAYWNLAQHHQPVVCLRRAIAAYGEALRYYSPEREPLYYAMIQNNLGTAYWNLAQHKQSAPDEVEAGDIGEIMGAASETYGQGAIGSLPTISSPVDWLHRAIAAYGAALNYRTVEAVPAAYAATQNNLGTAYWHLANLSNNQPDQRRQYLQQAIAAYKSALAAIHSFTASGAEHPPALTFDPSATHNNLGLAYYQVGIDKHSQDEKAKRSAYLEAALVHHLQALQGWQQNPDFYQTALGYVIQTTRTLYNEFGMQGQSLALSKIPAHLLPEIMKRL